MTRTLALIALIALIASGCVSMSTRIESSPPGATVSFRGKVVGTTPVDFQPSLERADVDAAGNPVPSYLRVEQNGEVAEFGWTLEGSPAMVLSGALIGSVLAGGTMVTAALAVGALYENIVPGSFASTLAAGTGFAAMAAVIGGCFGAFEGHGLSMAPPQNVFVDFEGVEPQVSTTPPARATHVLTKPAPAMSAPTPVAPPPVAPPPVAPPPVAPPSPS